MSIRSKGWAYPGEITPDPVIAYHRDLVALAEAEDIDPVQMQLAWDGMRSYTAASEAMGRKSPFEFTKQDVVQTIYEDPDTRLLYPWREPADETSWDGLNMSRLGLWTQEINTGYEALHAEHSVLAARAFRVLDYFNGIASYAVLNQAVVYFVGETQEPEVHVLKHAS